MNLEKLIEELISISSQNLNIDNKQYKVILNVRESYRNSMRNTINKLIENSCASQELKTLIYKFENKMEWSLVISLYRRYLWLEHNDEKIMYTKFTTFLADKEQEKQKLILNAIKNNDYDSALMVVEDIFDNTFIKNSLLVQPIKLRSLTDIAIELGKLETGEIASMRYTNASNSRTYYLREQLSLRINDPATSSFELREFFTYSNILSIILDLDIGLAIAKRYFGSNKTDRQVYGYFCIALSFYGLHDDVRLILQYVAINDFDNALKVVNSIEY